jgi:uncharacterized protein (TIGR02453 family)
MTFTGFPAAALDFYEDLEADNSRAFWAAHRRTYEDCVREPMRALLDELEPEFGAATLFRPHRDVRFSKDTSPYKTHQGGFVEVSDGVGYYVQVSAAGLLVAAGWHPREGQLRRFREAVLAPSGAQLERVLAQVERAGFTVGGDRLATRPRGQEPGQPREHLTRHKTLTAGKEHGSPPWLSSAATLGHVRDDWLGLTPLVGWLGRHVGPADRT